MKLIIAMIQPHKLPDVKKELFKNEIFKMTVTNVLGAGQQKGYTETYRGIISEVNLLKKVRLEIAVNEDFVEPAIDAIKKGAYTGKIGATILRPNITRNVTSDRLSTVRMFPSY